jgi:hypothetical protein
MSRVTGPRCPNHAVPLVDCHKGVGICPISSCQFTYKEDIEALDGSMKIDKFGNKVKQSAFIVAQADGGTGG